MIPDGGTDPGLARIIRPGKKTNPGALGSSHDIRHFRTLWVGHRAGGTLSSLIRGENRFLRFRHSIRWGTVRSGDRPGIGRLPS